MNVFDSFETSDSSFRGSEQTFIDRKATSEVNQVKGNSRFSFTVLKQCYMFFCFVFFSPHDKHQWMWGCELVQSQSWNFYKVRSVPSDCFDPLMCVFVCACRGVNALRRKRDLLGEEVGTLYLREPEEVRAPTCATPQAAQSGLCGGWGYTCSHINLLPSHSDSF